MQEKTEPVQGRVRRRRLAGLWGVWGREGDDSGIWVAATCEDYECPGKDYGLLLA